MGSLLISTEMTLISLLRPHWGLCASLETHHNDKLFLFLRKSWSQSQLLELCASGTFVNALKPRNHSYRLNCSQMLTHELYSYWTQLCGIFFFFLSRILNNALDDRSFKRMCLSFPLWLHLWFLMNYASSKHITEIRPCIPLCIQTFIAVW